MTSTINKFLVAVVSALGQLQIAFADSSAGGSTIVNVEWVGILLAAAAAVGVYAVPFASGRVAASRQGVTNP